VLRPCPAVWRRTGCNVGLAAGLQFPGRPSWRRGADGPGSVRRAWMTFGRTALWLSFAGVAGCDHEFS
jgi:hypothetical protein